MYTVHPSVTHLQAILRNLPTTTGKSLDQWLESIAQSGLKAKAEQVAWLKQHGIGGITAQFIALIALGEEVETTEEDYLKAAHKYVEEMYAAGKAHLRPMHDALITLALSSQPDIKISPCKTIIPLYRNHVIAQIKPSTKTRIDLGLSLRSLPEKHSGRLIEAGGLTKGDRITHRIEIHSLSDIDDEVALWLRRAYELDRS